MFTLTVYYVLQNTLHESIGGNLLQILHEYSSDLQ